MTDRGRPLRIGISTDGLLEREVDGRVQIANGGVGVYIENLVRNLLAVDATNEYFLIRWDGGHLDIYRDQRLRPVFVPATRFGGPGRWFDWQHRSVATELGLDLFHYPNQFGGILLPASVRRVVTLHDITPLLYPSFHPWRRVAGYRLLLRRALRAADAVIVDSSSAAHDLVARGMADAGRISVIPLGVNERFRPVTSTVALTERYDLPDTFLLTVGVFEPRKNHTLLFEVLSRLHTRGLRIGLVIVGRDGWGWRSPLDDPQLAPLRPWVRIYRNVPDADLPELYCRAAAFVYPSLYEGFGLPILEAMACGTPVVTSNVSSMPEVAGSAALLADPHSVEDFADCLESLLRDAALRGRLAAAGRLRAAAYTWRRTAEQTLAVYERVCAGTHAGTPGGTRSPLPRSHLVAGAAGGIVGPRRGA